MRLQEAGLLAASGREQSCLRELSSGVDALYLSGYGTVPGSLLSDLEGLRARAEDVGKPVALELGDVQLQVQPRGLGRYRFCLSHENGDIGVTPKEALPPIRVQPRSEFLHAVGARRAVAWFEELLACYVTDLRFSAARLDLYADWQGWHLEAADRWRFVGRASRRNTREDGDSLTGFEFGRRTSGTVLARVYDKRLQVEQKGLDWWLEVWGREYDPAQQVIRLEFELGRAGLRQFGVDTPRDALDSAAGLWANLTSSWLTLRTATADATRSRWPIAPEWERISRPSFAESAAGIERIREGKSRGSLRKLMPLLTGCLASFAALTGCRDVDDLLAELPSHLYDYGLLTRTPFAVRVQDRLAQAAGAA